ncbi:ATV_HP_G0159070.mRNA.1.CDS.1 [Saccharomyces cerevisiae]|nr:ATV_HP_G0159070.mRNA.1.CDS.1 [Saccharomyces cerevisiae]CAI6938410.1 ATV_HP_G0159070.mRNA.1.CDS.1 [Saccharomyces cerevisiae]
MRIWVRIYSRYSSDFEEKLKKLNGDFKTNIGEHIKNNKQASEPNILLPVKLLDEASFER